MKDIHCHILNGIDDGAKTIDESLNILKKASQEGITDIVLTPHYIKNTNYNCNNEKKQDLLNILQKEIIKNNINIKLYMGNEIMLDDSIIDMINNNEVSTINNTKYILVEFSMHSYNHNSKNIIFELIKNNYIPIIAHPERYSYIQDNIEKIDEFIQMGAILQGNYHSLLGKYGKSAKKTLIKLLKNNKISILASDIHHEKSDYQITDLKKKLKRVVKSEELIEDLLINNFDKIINNKNL